MQNITTFDFHELQRFDKIFVSVSGGYDSTYLYTLIKELYPLKTYCVNCYNPYEISSTLLQLKHDPFFIQIKPIEQYNYGEILKNAFLKLPDAFKLRSKGKYSKKVFGCCYYIKHKSYLNDPLYSTPNSVVISGIKRGDGQQRFMWCEQLRKLNTFFHTHKQGQVFCYPFRDYTKRELPITIKRALQQIYPTISHSGCSICPVLVLFNLKKESSRYIRSIQYAKQLGVIPSYLKRYQ